MDARPPAEELALLLSLLRSVTGGLNREADYQVRLTDARTSEHLATCFIDVETAQTVCDGLEAQVSGSRPRLRLAGGDA
jgi:hypothetical protein